MHTSDMSGAGTNAKVSMMVYGQKGLHSDAIALESESDAFEKVCSQTAFCVHFIK